MTKQEKIARMMKMIEMIKKSPKDWNKDEMGIFHQSKEKHIADEEN